MPSDAFKRERAELTTAVRRHLAKTAPETSKANRRKAARIAVGQLLASLREDGPQVLIPAEPTEEDGLSHQGDPDFPAHPTCH